MKKAVAYIRVSKKRENMLTINTQKDKIKKYCELHDIRLIDYYQDIDYSGRNSNRPDLQNMLSDIADGIIDIDVVLIYKLDRFSRSVKEFYQHVTALEKSGVDLISITQHFNTSTPTGRVMLNILIGFAQFESEMTGQRIKDNLQNNAERGRWSGGHAPYGYDWNEDDKLLEPNENAKYAQLIFDKYLELSSANRVVDLLHRRGILSPTGNDMWDRSVITHMLKNPIYIGQIQHNENVYDGKHEGIIDIDTFRKVNELLDSHNFRGKGRTYMLSGLIECGKCGKYGVHTSWKNKDTRHYRIMCKDRQEGDCDMSIIDTPSLNKAVLNKIISVLNRKNYFKKVKDNYTKENKSDIRRLKQRKRKLTERKNKIDGILSNIFADYYDNEIMSREQFQEYTEKYDAKKKSILDRIDQVQTEIESYEIDNADVDIIKDNIISLKRDINFLSHEDKNLFAQYIIRKVIFYEDKAVIDIYIDKLKIPVKKVYRNVLYF